MYSAVYVLIVAICRRLELCFVGVWRGHMRLSVFVYFLAASDGHHIIFLFTINSIPFTCPGRGGGVERGLHRQRPIHSCVSSL